ncbi:MAG TPA: glycosyltransferase N-terminal domain-containing protein [Bacteroidales bacterium]|nr:glycosyltransferase N-terminal domain-containing protein [Bacteroidales bacterium]
MSLIWLVLYNLIVVPLIYIGFWIGSLFNAKIKEGLKARRNQFRKLAMDITRAGNRKRILFHCTSAGEWLQALPIIEKMKAENPQLFIMVSFYSPSGYKFAKNPPQVDLKFYLPLDSVFAARRLFKMLKPELWIISKFDIWPNHVMIASLLKIPMVVSSATLSADSGRDKGISKGFNRLVYNRISHIFPISEDDKRRFQVMVPDESKYTIAGDTRYDHVYNRGVKAENEGDVPVFRDRQDVIFIAGSTWPADEKHVLPALVRLCERFTTLQVIIVPHELQENHLRDIESVFEEAGITTERYTSFYASGKTDARVVIFNTIGMLARLYRQTSIAYIGGSFGKGIHNVMEPAVFEQPVIFGPNYLNSYEAGELLRIGAAFTIDNEQEFYDKALLLIQDRLLRNSMGEKAKNLIYNNIGATDIIMNTLKKLYGTLS